VLLEAGASVEFAVEDSGITSLMKACHNGHDQCARALIEAKADLEKMNQDSVTALILSCQNGHVQCARALIEARAAVDHMDNNGWTALMAACQDGHDQCVHVLLQAGADRGIEVPGHAGWDAQKLAERNGHTAICELLMEELRAAAECLEGRSASSGRSSGLGGAAASDDDDTYDDDNDDDDDDDDDELACIFQGSSHLFRVVEGEGGVITV
jgi:ankyrin repeat protein